MVFRYFEIFEATLFKQLQVSHLIDADAIHGVVTKCCSSSHTKALQGLQQ